MFRAKHNTEIGKSVVQLIPVNVVDNFVGLQCSSEKRFHNVPMFQNGLTANVDLTIPMIPDATLTASSLPCEARVSVSLESQVVGIAESLRRNLSFAPINGAKIGHGMIGRSPIRISKNSVHGSSSLPFSLPLTMMDGKRSGASYWVNSGKPRPGDAEGNPERSRKYTCGTCNDYWRGKAPLMTSTSARPEREEIV